MFFPLSRTLLVRSGRRFPRLIQVCANLATMLVIGWWHGSTLTFIAWGAWHGALLSLEHLLGVKPGRWWSRLLGWLLTIHLVGAGWILFRSPSFTAAGRYFAGLAAFEQMHWLPVVLPPVVAALMLSALLDWLPGSPIFTDTDNAWTARLRPIRHILVSAALVLLGSLALLALARGGDTRPFIYSQF
jgi:hypothetical protein